MTNWERPKIVLEIRSFMGLAGYYRRFIQGFSQLALPLSRLTRKESHFRLDERCEHIFVELKEKLTTTLTLIIPDPEKPYIVICDSSKKGLGGVLMQDERVVAYVSR